MTKYVAIFRDEYNNVVDGIEIKTFLKDMIPIYKAVSNYAYDLMAKRGMRKLNWEILNK
jgi:hypothetical protein